MRAASLAVLFAACLAGCDGDPEWAGRYDGRFEGTYVATDRLVEGQAHLVRSTFAGTAWIEIAPRDDGDLGVHVTDCDMVWAVDGDEAAYGGEPEPSGCLLDVSGATGVVEVRPTSGRATLDDDRLALEYSSAGPAAAEDTPPSSLTFHFEGRRR